MSCNSTFNIFINTSTFFAVLEIENEFGLVLGILLAAIIIIFAIWIVVGIKQHHHSISLLGKRYNDYVKRKEALDRRLALQQYDDNNVDPSISKS
jgi:hypothetical protein